MKLSRPLSLSAPTSLGHYKTSFRYLPVLNRNTNGNHSR